jgi:hypothetical protein
MSVEYKGRIVEDDELRDILDSIPELQAEIIRLRQALRSIGAMCNAPHWTSDRRWKIEELASTALKPRR